MCGTVPSACILPYRGITISPVFSRKAVPMLVRSPILLLLLCSAGLAEDRDIAESLALAGENRAAIQAALDGVTGSPRTGMEFLVRHMPVRDLQNLSAEFLLQNVRLAYKTRSKVPWGKSIPEDVFLNDVLPYASVNEQRDPWRRQFSEKFLPLVAECKTPTEAAQELNRQIFGMLKVRYSTKRKRADQSPKESIQTGLASCTGLSIVLADACRSVCVPRAARRNCVLGQQARQSHMGRSLGPAVVLYWCG